jgi:hypothetical protein
MYLHKTLWVFVLLGVRTMALLDLPDELLQNVVEQTIPKGFESLSLSNKKIYNIAQEYIPTHNRLKRSYQHFRYTLKIKHAFHLLHRIADEPLIAEYIEHADLRPINNNDIDDYSDLHIGPEVAEKITDFIKKLEENSHGEPVQRMALLKKALDSHSANDFQSAV